MADFDFIVVGAGLAGGCAALALSEHGSVLILEKDRPAAGGSGAAAGLVNPILGIRARPVWRLEEALDALENTVRQAGAWELYRRRATLRPASGEEQCRRFPQTALEYPEHAEWLTPAEVAARYPAVTAPEGALLIKTGGAVDIGRLVHRLIAAAESRGAVLRTGTSVISWSDEGESAVAALTGGERISARFVVLCLGPEYAAFPELKRLRLHRVKGQTIRLSRPQAIPADLPHIAASAYVVQEDGALVAGGSYEHVFDHDRPTAGGTADIIARLRRVLPAIEDARVLEERAGIRVTVPGIRLPMVGPIPGCRRVWIFSGFGAKGLLTAPLAARELPSYIRDPGSIPVDTGVRPANA